MTTHASVLRAENIKHYIDAFNQNDEDLYSEVQTFKNGQAWDFLKDQIPLLDCPDKCIEEIYYFRWWTYRKHIHGTSDGFVITEFLPNVPWAGKHNTINCPASFHISEGRWLRDARFINDYLLFWLRKGEGIRRYSFWIADAVWNQYLVTGDVAFAKDLLPDLVDNYREWEKSHQDANGLFWQIDDRDGMELSIGGYSDRPIENTNFQNGDAGYRATINSYMYGDARAIARLSVLAGDFAQADVFLKKAAKIKDLVQENLWSASDKFFKVLPRDSSANLVSVRELHGFTPWYFNLPDPGFEIAWKQLTDPQGFSATFGPTTAEQRSPDFKVAYEGHECQWNGPSWPFATSITLAALANLLNNYQQGVMTRQDYFDLFRTYTKSQHRTREDGIVVPWIDENLNPFTGDWISRTRLLQGKQPPHERGKDYNHSLYCDLIINGLIGLRPCADDVVEINPLVPDDTWDYFCLDNVLYHGHVITILYDKSGTQYGRGSGLRLFASGQEIAHSPTLGLLSGDLT